MADLVELADVKTWLAVGTSTAMDDQLRALITATSADFLQAIQRDDFLAADYVEVQEGDGGPRLTTRHWPINTVSAITLAGVGLSTSADKVAAGYYIDLDLDPERRAQIWLAGGATFKDGAAVSVSYNAGYAATPADVAQAVMEWIAERWRNRAGVGVASQRDAGGEHTAFDKPEAMPATTAGVVQRYMRDVPTSDRYSENRAQAVTRITRVFTQTQTEKDA